jgi:hypothetical protein
MTKFQEITDVDRPYVVADGVAIAMAEKGTEGVLSKLKEIHNEWFKEEEE